MTGGDQNEEKGCGLCHVFLLPCYILLITLILVILPFYVLYLIGKCLVDFLRDMFGCRKDSNESDNSEDPPPSYEDIQRHDRSQSLPGYYDLPPRYTPSMQRHSIPEVRREFPVEVV